MGFTLFSHFKNVNFESQSAKEKQCYLSGVLYKYVCVQSLEVEEVGIQQLEMLLRLETIIYILMAIYYP